MDQHDYKKVIAEEKRYLFVSHIETVPDLLIRILAVIEQLYLKRAGPNRMSFVILSHIYCIDRSSVAFVSNSALTFCHLSDVKTNTSSLASTISLSEMYGANPNLGLIQTVMFSPCFEASQYIGPKCRRGDECIPKGLGLG